MTEIIVSPFSNSSIRDWPAERFRDLIGLLLAECGPETTVRVTGTAGQRLRACGIVRPFPADRVINDCGRSTWPQVLGFLQEAGCVIGNNSGVSHIAAFLGAPTVCVFGGSHQRAEWRPQGRNVVVVSRSIGCSPCHLDHNRVSPYGKACLREIAPEAVRDAVVLAIRHRGESATGNGHDVR